MSTSFWRVDYRHVGYTVQYRLQPKGYYIKLCHLEQDEFVLVSYELYKL